MGQIPRVLVLLGSPRSHRNSETLADSFLEPLAQAGCAIEKLVVSSLEIKPCTACEACNKTGRCVLGGDMDRVYEKLDEADWVVLVSPVYFNSVTGSLKVLIDRCQIYWARKFVLKRPPVKTGRLGFLLMSAGIFQKAEALNGSWRVADYFFKAQDIAFREMLCLDQTDACNEEHFKKIHRQAAEAAFDALEAWKSDL